MADRVVDFAPVQRVTVTIEHQADVVELHIHPGSQGVWDARMVAAVLARGGSVEDAIRTGAAAGALNATRHGLGTGRAATVRELIDRVDLTPA